MIDVAHDGSSGASAKCPRGDEDHRLRRLDDPTRPRASRQGKLTPWPPPGHGQRRGAHCGQSASGRERARVTEGESRLAAMPTLVSFSGRGGRPRRRRSGAGRALAIPLAARSTVDTGGWPLSSRPGWILARSPIPTTHSPLKGRSGGRDRFKGLDQAGAGREAEKSLAERRRRIGRSNNGRLPRRAEDESNEQRRTEEGNGTPRRWRSDDTGHVAIGRGAALTLLAWSELKLVRGWRACCYSAARVLWHGRCPGAAIVRDAHRALRDRCNAI